MVTLLPWVLYVSAVAGMPKYMHHQLAMIERMSSELHAKVFVSSDSSPS